MGGLSYSSGGYLTAVGAILWQGRLAKSIRGGHFRRACLSLNSASGPFIIDFTYNGALMLPNSTTVTGSQASRWGGGGKGWTRPPDSV